MEKIKLQVSGSQIQVIARPAAITAGTVGLEAEFSFDSHWDNLAKTVIFRAGDTVITAALEQDTHIVPWEVLEKPDLWLIVGVYGANPEGTVVIPTLWTKVAAVYTGVDPEGDPALEPSNPIWQETLARVANMEPQLQGHINDMNNPHGITCGQIGAVTQKEFQDVVSNLDGSSDSDELIPHLLNRDNPHGVTAAQAGAAPAGFGLGERASPATTWKWANSNGFSRSSNDSPDGSLWWGITSVRDNGIGSQIAFSKQNNILTEARRVYTTNTTYGTISGIWEYVNPPLASNVEYRTTERHAEKPVYVRVIGTGYLPNAGTKTIAHSIEDILAVLSIHGIATDGRTIPYKNGNESIEVAADKTNIYVTTTTNMTAQNGTFCIKYIKTTD